MNLTKITLCAFAMTFATQAFSCTNFIVTKGASADGSTMVTYAADSHVLYGELYRFPAANHKRGEKLAIREWDTNKYLGEIAQVAHTYSVVGNVNEFQLTIGETTFGGRDELVDTTGIIDYGSLIYITLQRARNAREAIRVMTSLVAAYGYCSGGESFSIADPNEAWIMEMVGKGSHEQGALWVAVRIPDGYVSGHANQARITTFPLNDPENCLYAPDLISFARAKGYFNAEADSLFSFADAFNPLDFEAKRCCEARVWSGFRKMNAEMDKYADYAFGISNERMPLYIKPDHKITRRELTNIMRDHYEGTIMDMTQDVGAGPFGVPYRWRPLEYEVDGKTYLHERAIATQQTGFWFVSQMRDANAAGGIIWFGCDDANTSVLVPIYTSTTVVPIQFAQGTADMLTFSWNSAFWIFNWVANMAYSRYNIMIGDIRKRQVQLEDELDQAVAEMDKRMAELSKDKTMRAMVANTFAAEQTNKVVDSWKSLGEFLMVKYNDGNVHPEHDGVFDRTKDGNPVSPQWPGYGDKYYRAIVEQTGDKFIFRDSKK
ncbi:MAG: C69 family dipeptidase [Bacteroidales bacterium]|nr:C69 family dipeptidase [Bacteroidales bacterium]